MRMTWNAAEPARRWRSMRQGSWLQHSSSRMAHFSRRCGACSTPMVAALAHGGRYFPIDVTASTTTIPLAGFHGRLRSRTLPPALSRGLCSHSLTMMTLSLWMLLELLRTCLVCLMRRRLVFLIFLVFFVFLVFRFLLNFHRLLNRRLFLCTPLPVTVTFRSILLSFHCLLIRSCFPCSLLLVASCPVL